MTLGLVAKVFTIWLGILVLAVANGLLREAVLMPQLGKPAGLVLSGLLLSLLILAVAYLTVPWFGPGSIGKFVVIGLIWLGLTLVFEFGFGRLVEGKSWHQLLEVYTFKGGNIWPLVLLVTAAAPTLVARIRGWG